jgi:hypothetical protein
MAAVMTAAVWAVSVIVVIHGPPAAHPADIGVDFLHFQNEVDSLLIEFLRELGNVLLKCGGFLGIRILLGKLALQFQSLLIHILPQVLGIIEKCLAFFIHGLLVFITQIARTQRAPSRLTGARTPTGRDRCAEADQQESYYGRDGDQFGNVFHGRPPKD